MIGLMAGNAGVTWCGIPSKTHFTSALLELEPKDSPVSSVRISAYWNLHNK